MTPCMRLYAYLGGELVGKCRPQHPYQPWIEAYSGKEFGRLAALLETLLDRFAADNREIRDSYRYALQCELDFFSGVLREPQVLPSLLREAENPRTYLAPKIADRYELRPDPSPGADRR
jgi:hypothetical protein